MTSEIDLYEARAKGVNYTTIWDALTGPIFRVLDEDGNNVADCQCRHFLGAHWLCVDDTDGYYLMDEDDVAGLILSPEIDQTQPVLYRYTDSVALRNATPEELSASNEAAESDGGAGVIEVDGVDCYVQE